MTLPNALHRARAKTFFSSPFCFSNFCNVACAHTIYKPSENVAVDRPFGADGRRSTILYFHSDQLRLLHTSQGTLVALEWRIHQRLMIGYSIPACERSEDDPRLLSAPQEAPHIIRVFAKRAFAQLRDTLTDDVLSCLRRFPACFHFVYEL